MSERSVEGGLSIGAAPVDRTRLFAGALALAGMVFLIVAGGLLLAQRNRAPAVTLIVQASHAQLEAGFALYQRHCASCHGAFLSGAPGWRADARLAPALNETGHAFNHSDLDLFRRVAQGVRAPDGRITMPAFGGVLSEPEIVILLSYIAAWWPDAVRSGRAASEAGDPAICGPAARSAGPPADAT